jgi:hypothetical protein
LYPAVRRKYLISAVRSLFLSHCLIVQISLPYKRVGRANVLYNFNLVLLRTKSGFNVLLESPSICKKKLKLFNVFYILRTDSSSNENTAGKKQCSLSLKTNLCTQHFSDGRTREERTYCMVRTLCFRGSLENS